MAAPRVDGKLEAVIRRARDDLAALGYPCALVGGLAVSARTEPRFTRDVDLAVALDSDREAEALIRALQRRGYRIATVVEQEAVGRLATIRLEPDDAEHGVVLDLLFASSGIESEIVRAADTLEVFPGLELPVATIGHLLAIKVLARDDEQRPQDLVDIRALLKEATPRDLDVARRAAELIVERGFHRRRDLVAAVEQLRGG